MRLPHGTAAAKYEDNCAALHCPSVTSLPALGIYPYGNGGVHSSLVSPVKNTDGGEPIDECPPPPPPLPLIEMATGVDTAVGRLPRFKGGGLLESGTGGGGAPPLVDPLLECTKGVGGGESW
jgi:hypothetical protein